MNSVENLIPYSIKENKSNKEIQAINSLSFNQIVNFGSIESIYKPNALQIENVNKSYANLKLLMTKSDNKIYGINTQFGADVKASVNKNNLQHQVDLIDYLSVGSGENLNEVIVRRALRLQAHKSGHGYSGISPSTYYKLINLSNSSQLPCVPKNGSLGASGDLIPMAHAVSPIFSGHEVNIEGPRDALSLVNTNSIMASYASELFLACEKILNLGFEITAKNSVALGYSNIHFNKAGIAIPHQDPFVILAAEKLDDNISLLNCTNNDVSISQAQYSIRCAPFVLGNVLWSINEARKFITIEANRVADNPIILSDFIFHGGHFYAIGISQAADMMSDAIGKISEMIDRQILLLMSPETNNGLPRNLEIDGKNHLKGLHQLVSSILQRIKGLSFTSAQMSFSCESNNQDIVPCGMSALNSLSDKVDLVCQLLKASSFVSERALKIKLNDKTAEIPDLNKWRESNAP